MALEQHPTMVGNIISLDRARALRRRRNAPLIVDHNMIGAAIVANLVVWGLIWAEGMKRVYGW